MVNFIDKGKNRDAPVGTDLEQFFGLRFHALCHVNHHDCRVYSHQRTVGIFGKVRMPRGIQDIDAAPLVIKLEYRTGHGNPSLLFDFHPIGHGIAGCFPCLDRTCQMNSTSVKKKFFRQCSFTGVGVRNDRKGPAPFDFFQISHVSPQSKIHILYYTLYERLWEIFPAEAGHPLRNLFRNSVKIFFPPGYTIDTA